MNWNHLKELQEIGDQYQAALNTGVECSHKKTEMRLKTAQNNAKHIVNQCLSCGERIGMNISKHSISEAEYLALKPFDETLIKKFDYLSVKNEKDIKFWDWYTRYLQTPTWRNKRLQVLKRDNFKCQGCLAEATQVHHKTYEHVGKELLFELISLCDECHNVIHDH